MGIRIFWQRMRDSNPRKRSQSPVCYRYTNPLSENKSYYTQIFQKVKCFLKIIKNYFSQGKGLPGRTLSRI